MFEVPEKSDFARGVMKHGIRILCFDEFGLEYTSNAHVELQSELVLSGTIFDTLDVDNVKACVSHCEKFKSGYKVKATFLGLRESQQKRIRQWIQNHSYRNKKGEAA